MDDQPANSKFTYDEILYPTPAIPIATPDRMMAAGLMRGWRSAEPATASVLEIGCGTGENLIAIGAAAPRGRCVGFDLSGRAIAIGRGYAEKAGTTNVELLEGDIMTWPHEGEKFDYIICHGVYTWIPEPVRAATLALIGARLAPGGVAYIGYDTLPAAASKAAINPFLRRHTAHLADPAERIQRAAEMLAMLYRNQHEGSRLKPQLDQIAAEIKGYKPAYFYHDWLAEFYEPLFLTTMCERAAANGLAFAGDGLMLDLITDDLDPEASALVEQAGDDLVQRNASLDMLRGERMFRQDHFVRAGAPMPAESDPWARLIFGFTGDREPVEGPEGVPATKYSRGQEVNLVTYDTPEDQVMVVLADDTPQEMSAPQLAERTGLQLDEVKRILRRLGCAGLIDVHSTPQPFVARPGERPRASRLVRSMLARGNTGISLRHSTYQAKDDAARTFVALCDGSRDRDELAREMSQRFVPTTRAQVEVALVELAEHALFEA